MRARAKLAFSLSGIGTVALAAVSASAAPPLSIRDSFRIGTSGTIFCSAQPVATDAVLTGMFDNGYSITCRDAASAVGTLYKLKGAASGEARLATSLSALADCQAAREERVEGLGTVLVADCRMREDGVGYRAYRWRNGDTLYAATGLAGYDSALLLGLRTIVADAPVPGELKIATTGAGDPAAFARVQAGTMDPTKALAEAYRRNNAGSYAEAAEFFAAVGSAKDAPMSRTEILANEALQKSNLGRYAEADSLFSRASAALDSDPVVARRLRNYRALHELNQRDAARAIRELDKLPVARLVGGKKLAANGAAIDASVATMLNSDSAIGRQLGAENDNLLPSEKQEILDAQALQLRGTALRLQGKDEAAIGALRQADELLQSVRSGMVTSIAWMRAQILGDLAAIAEKRDRLAEAESYYRDGITLIETGYPGSAALLNARARLAGFLHRQGNDDEAEAIFAAIVKSQPDANNIPPSFANVLVPYLDILLKRPDDPAAQAALFSASQLMVRPGLSQTQAVLARELSGGSDEAARLFRQSVSLTRQIEQNRVELARLEGLPKIGSVEASRIRVLREMLSRLNRQQVATQASLTEFPRYRAVSSDLLGLDELQSVLEPDEAYYRMTVVGDAIYAMMIDVEGLRSPQAVRRRGPIGQAGRRAARNDFDRREWPTHHVRL